MVFENYGAGKYHDDHVQSTLYSLRFSKYKEPKKTGIDVGLGTHTDKTFTTILHQNHVNGLEISTKDDEWIGCEYPLPSSFLFLAGDVLQVCYKFKMIDLSEAIHWHIEINWDTLVGLGLEQR